MAATLKQSGRFSSVHLTVTTSFMRKLPSIVGPFSALEDLVLLSQGRLQLTLVKHSDCVSSIGLTITGSLLVIIRH
jgi:hypothetical protein